MNAKCLMTCYTKIMITAVDVGGTKTLIAQFNGQKKMINELRFPTPEDQDEFLSELVKHLSSLDDVTSISMGIPGRAKDGVILYCPNLPLWKNVPVEKTLHSAFKCRVLIENDANLAGLAEINALSPLPEVGLYLTVSTGIGSGLVVNGRLASGLSGHSMGHMVFNHAGKWQEWEDFASGRAIVAHFGKLAQDLKTTKEWEWVAEQIAVGLCAILHPLRPDVVVFGGGVGEYLKHFKQPLEDILDKRLPDPSIRPPFHVAKHPYEAVLYGCYYHATHHTT
jgi:predicted NBD/HSP70 family sugar kinase